MTRKRNNFSSAGPVLRVLATVGTLGIVSCTESTESTDAGGTPIEALPEAIADSLCTVVEGCLSQDTIARVYGPAGCLGTVVPDITDSEFGLIADAIDAGRVRYDGSKADACLAELEAAGCDFDSQRVFSEGACAELMTGTVGHAEDCTLDAECEGNLFCQIENSCPGSCAELLAHGEACEDSDDCEDGLGCEDERCTPVVGPGKTCEGDSGAVCRFDLACLEGDDGNSECVQQSALLTGKLGEPCNLDGALELCEDGLSCAIFVDSGGARFECVAHASTGGDCQVAIPDMCPLGEQCDADTEQNRFDGRCQALPAAGDSCDDDNPCGPGLQCDDGRCTVPGRIGDTCTGDDGCYSGQCDDGACAQQDPCPE